MKKQFIATFVGIALAAGAVIAQQKPDMFTLLDKNKDNVLTKQEYMSHIESTFSSMDKNNDGKIDGEEREAQRQIWKAAGYYKNSPAGAK